MATICFDIKRVDDEYVCIQHCDLNKFEYEYHLGFSFYPRTRKHKNHWWLEDKKYRYVWIVVEKDKDTGIERIVWACNDKVWLNHTIRSMFADRSIRIVKLPFNRIKHRVSLFNNMAAIWETNDMKDKFQLYCPADLNEKHHIYSDHYEEIEPKITGTAEIDGKIIEFKERQFKWIPPKYLEEE